MRDSIEDPCLENKNHRLFVKKKVLITTVTNLLVLAMFGNFEPVVVISIVLVVKLGMLEAPTVHCARGKQLNISAFRSSS
ncbi:hypothetical protein Leryth_003678 [Lithospermum erythrorhizon]|nr:hypothetical protein Leryth_003678 [Lithospermum erythrorhizon]